MRRRDDGPVEIAEVSQKKMTNVFLLAAALLLILKAVLAQACTVQLQWDGPSSVEANPASCFRASGEWTQWLPG